MAKASDNPFPSVLVVEGTTPASPASGDQRLFIDSADHKLKRVNSAGSVTTIEGGGGSGTLAGDTDVSLSGLAAKQILQYNGTAWANVSGGLIKVAESVLGASAASVTLSVPSGYRHLQLVIDSRGDPALSNTPINLTFNADTGANYDYVNPYFVGSSTTPAVGANVAQTALFLGWATAASAPANESSQILATIFNYAGTTFQKGVSSEITLRQATATSGIFSGKLAGWWRSTAAITSITLTPGAGNFIAGSTFSLYAIP